ncbi:MAG: S8 family serine peptidase [Aliivibrio sp.]|uniref:S8 family serine peptidase n=1 Tax=Aliivibrio sp. TaxID=1872443 RepID=UPI001A60F7E3|nr:S8 family serine peptidase [Aliivibrio sp.]
MMVPRLLVNKPMFTTLSFTLAAALILLFSSVTFSAPPHERYVVVLHKNMGPPINIANDIASNHRAQIGFVYNHVLQGFSVALPAAAVNAIQRDPRVAYVEKSIEIRLFAQDIPTGVTRIFANFPVLSIDGDDSMRVDVDVAVLDTGIDRQHPDLNVVGGTNCLKTTKGGPPRSRSYFCDSSKDGDDDHYHGTHVAGTIAALDNNIGVVGVAPGARLWAVKVLDSQGSGSLAGIIAAIDWVVAQGDIEVINMSLGGTGSSQAMDDAISAAFNSGVVVVVAAGNSADDAMNYTPANSPDAITVSALADFDGTDGYNGLFTCRYDVDDTLADFSNFGATVDIIAPGACIYSTYPIERGSYNTISGTSMASPHVAGAAALLASNHLSTATIWTTLVDSGNYNWTDDAPDNIQEPLLDISGFVPTLINVSVTPNSPPTANFSYACSASTCDFDGSQSGDDDGSIVLYEWDFGDGNSDSNDSSSLSNHTYTVDGTYTVTLIVTDDNGATGSKSLTVTVPVAEVTLIGSVNNSGPTWRAIVTATDTNVVLMGVWTHNSGTPSCHNNVCELSGISKKNEPEVSFTSDGGIEVIINRKM